MIDDKKSLEEQIELQKQLIANNKEQVDKALELFETIRAIRRDYGEIDQELQTQLDGATEVLRQNEESLRALENLESTLENIVDNNEMFLEDNKELYDIMTSIGSMLGKNNKLYETANVIYKGQQTTLSSISKLMEVISDKDLKRKALEASYAYKDMGVSVADAGREIEKGNITQDEYNRLILKSYDALENVVHSIDESTQEGKDLKEMLMAAKNEMQSFAEAARKSQMHMQQMDQLFNSFSGIPVMGELNTLLKTNIKDTLAWQAAVFALGAALAKLAFDYFGTPMKVALEFDHKIAENKLKLAQDLEKLNIEGQFIPAKIGLERDKNAVETANTVNRLTVEAGFAATKAANQFRVQMQEGAAQFRAAAKTARFGGQLGPTGYNVAELNLAGIDPGQISQQMSELASMTGKVPTAALATDMALVAKRTGQSTESIASLTEYFQRTDNLSADTAVNMVEGMRAMAKASGLDLGNLMAGVAEASKDALSYQIMSAEALTKQVAAAQSIGVNFNKLAGAGRNMVLNYKDSIKAEMQLSGLLGRSVNLSEVRAKAMSGDYTGMMEAMKAQGLDPSQMNMFQQQALQQAMGGMDLESIQKIYKGEITKPEDLTAGNAKKGGQEFLTKTKQAQASLAAESANIQAQAAIVDAKLSGKITDAYLGSPGYKKYLEEQNRLAAAEATLATNIQNAVLASEKYRGLESEIRKSEMLFNMFNNALEGVVMFLGGLVMNKIMGGKGAEGPMDMIKGMFGKKGGPTPTVTPSLSDLGGKKEIAKKVAEMKAANPNLTSADALKQIRQSATPTPTPASGGIMNNLFNPKSMTKGMKIGGGAVAGIMGGISAFGEMQSTETDKLQKILEKRGEELGVSISDTTVGLEEQRVEAQKYLKMDLDAGLIKKEDFEKQSATIDAEFQTKQQNLSTLQGEEKAGKEKVENKAAGAAIVQGGLAATGAVVGAAFGGPLGMMIGGFLGDTVGGWINTYAPGVAESFGHLWEGFKTGLQPLADAWETLKGKFQPIIDAIGSFMSSIGMEGGLGSVFSFVGEVISTALITPFKILLNTFGFLADIVTSVVKLFKGDFAGAWNTLKQGFLDLMSSVFSPFEKVFVTIYNGFASLWNGILDTPVIGSVLKGLGASAMTKKEMPKAEPQKTTTTTTANANTTTATAQNKTAATTTTGTTTTAATTGALSTMYSSTGTTTLDPKIAAEWLGVLKQIQSEAVTRGIAVETKLNELYKGTNGLYVDSMYGIKSFNRLDTISPNVPPLLENTKLTKAGIEKIPPIIIKATNAELTAQSNIIQLLEANVLLLEKIVDNTDGDGKQGTNIVLDGRRLNKMLTSYTADGKGLAQKNWNVS